MTDPSWPQIMRVSPMLDWTYEQVWTFLRSLTLPYCSLYNRGWVFWLKLQHNIPIISNSLFDLILIWNIPNFNLCIFRYTSIGSRSNTVPNDSLKFTDGSGKELYRAAYTLNDCSAERTGRQWRYTYEIYSTKQTILLNADYTT